MRERSDRERGLVGGCVRSAWEADGDATVPSAAGSLHGSAVSASGRCPEDSAIGCTVEVANEKDVSARGSPTDTSIAAVMSSPRVGMESSFSGSPSSNTDRGDAESSVVALSAAPRFVTLYSLSCTLSDRDPSASTGGTSAVRHCWRGDGISCRSPRVTQRRVRSSTNSTGSPSSPAHRHQQTHM